MGDNGNDRVLMYNVAPGTIANGMNASNVLGQSTYTGNTGGNTQSTFDDVDGVSYDANTGRLFVSDPYNARVLVFSAGPGTIANGENASFVVGQSNFTNNGGATTQSGFARPVGGVFYDSTQNRLFVSDFNNNRIMIFKTNNPDQVENGEAADYVFGQVNFTSGSENQGGATPIQSSLDQPQGVTYDTTNNQVYVSDGDNNRLMMFNTAAASIANGENATDELGEYTSPSSSATDLWTAPGPNNGPTALGFNNPNGKVALDTANHYLYVSDYNNNRVLVYVLNNDNSIPTSSGGHTATYVLGQTGLQGANGTGYGMAGMSGPIGLAYDAVNQRLFVDDQHNDRVLVFSTNGGVSTGMSASYYIGGCYGTTQACFENPQDVAYDAANSRLFVADTYNNRVMVFNVAPGFTNGENASYVLGQADFTHGSCNQGGSAAQNTLCPPNNISYDAVNSRLFVGDIANERVLVFNVAPGTIASNENASYELGQPSSTAFTSTGSGSSASTFIGPAGLSYDANSGRLFVADTYNSRVTVFNVAPGTIANGENASYVLGQTAFGLGNYATTQSGLHYTQAVFYDPGSGRLFVTDTNNNRIVIFEGGYGAPNFMQMLPD